MASKKSSKRLRFAEDAPWQGCQGERFFIQINGGSIVAGRQEPDFQSASRVVKVLVGIATSIQIWSYSYWVMGPLRRCNLVGQLQYNQDSLKRSCMGYLSLEMSASWGRIHKEVLSLAFSALGKFLMQSRILLDLWCPINVPYHLQKRHIASQDSLIYQAFMWASLMQLQSPLLCRCYLMNRSTWSWCC